MIASFSRVSNDFVIDLYPQAELYAPPDAGPNPAASLEEAAASCRAHPFFVCVVSLRVM